MKYTINLIEEGKEGRKFVSTYESTIAPIPGDMISLSDTSIFIVEKRMLGIGNTEAILCFGKVN